MIAFLHILCLVTKQILVRLLIKTAAEGKELSFVGVAMFVDSIANFTKFVQVYGIKWLLPIYLFVLILEFDHSNCYLLGYIDYLAFHDYCFDWTQAFLAEEKLYSCVFGKRGNSLQLGVADSKHCRQLLRNSPLQIRWTVNLMRLHWLINQLPITNLSLLYAVIWQGLQQIIAPLLDGVQFIRGDIDSSVQFMGGAEAIVHANYAQMAIDLRKDRRAALSRRGISRVQHHACFNNADFSLTHKGDNDMPIVIALVLLLARISQYLYPHSLQHLYKTKSGIFVQVDIRLEYHHSEVLAIARYPILRLEFKIFLMLP